MAGARPKSLEDHSRNGKSGHRNKNPAFLSLFCRDRHHTVTIRKTGNSKKNIPNVIWNFNYILVTVFTVETIPTMLLAGEAFEVCHLAFHFLAGGVGGGTDTLDAQLEFVGVGGAE
jgi:hypothetical protein